MNSLVHNCQNNATYSILYISEAFSLCVNILKSHRIFMEVLSHTVAFIVKIAGFFFYRNCPEHSALTKAFTNDPLRNTWIYRHFFCSSAGTDSPSNSFLAIPSIMSVQQILEL